jgi:hypothetical protein
MPTGSASNLRDTQEFLHVSDRRTNKTLYCRAAPGAGLANSGTCYATAAEASRTGSAYYSAGSRAGSLAEPAMRNLLSILPPLSEIELANNLKHDGIRVGEIIAYRAWRVLGSNWMRRGDNRLHSVFINDYVWLPDRPASGDVREHGIYSFKDVIRSRGQYGHPLVWRALLFGSVKIWGDIVEHEAGYRSQFAKIVSLDYGDPELLEKFRAIYGVNARNRSAVGNP